MTAKASFNIATPDAMTPNRVISPNSVRLIILTQASLFFIFWSLATPPVIPKPWEVTQALADLWNDGIVGQLLVSLTLYVEALTIASILSLALAYTSTIPFFRPIAEGYSKLRFLGLVGLPFLFTLYIDGVHLLKLALLTFSISVFLVTSMLDVVDDIPKEKYDLARTLRMNEWEVLYEVVILGRADVAFSAIRQNSAIGWMMLPMIEGLFKSEGGIGAVLDIQNHHFHLSQIAAIQLLVIAIGLAQDYVIGFVKRIACPYASLLLERR
jgi:NitT/TauT family transport system permease protein